MKSLFKSVAIITVFSVLTRFAGFMFRIYLSRAIGPEGLGIYQVAFSVFAVLLTIVASGLPLIISKNSAKYIVKKDKAQERKTVTAGFFIALAASIFLCLLVLVLKNVLKVSFTDKRCIEILMILLPAVVFSSIYGVFRGNLWGHSNYFAVCFAEFFEQVLRIVICVIMLSQVLSSFDGAMSAAKSLTISCLFSAILVVILYFANGGRISKCKNEYREIIKTSAPITGVRFATSMIQPIIAVLIPLRLVAAGFSSSQAISLLGIAVGMTMPFLFIPSTLVGSLSMALIPDLSMAQEAKNEKHISNRITSSISLSLFFSSFLVPLYMGAGEQIGKFFFDNAQSGILLSSAAWIMIPIGISNITSAILNALGLETKSFKNNIIGAIFLLLCIWFLPKYIGIKALIWGMGTCMSAVAILNIAMIKKKANIKLKILCPLLKLCAFMIPTTAITAFLTNILANYIPLFFTLAISCSFGALFFVLLSIIFKIINVTPFFVKFKKFNLKSMKMFKKHKKVVKIKL